MSKKAQRDLCMETIKNVLLPDGCSPLQAHLKYSMYTVDGDFVLRLQALGSGMEGLIDVSYGPGQIRCSADTLQVAVDHLYRMVQEVALGIMLD